MKEEKNLQRQENNFRSCQRFDKTQLSCQNSSMSGKQVAVPKNWNFGTVATVTCQTPGELYFASERLVSRMFKFQYLALAARSSLWLVRKQSRYHDRTNKREH